MRIAVLADIHGNLPAFEAALERVARQKVDRIVIAGDVAVGGPDSAACWRLARSLGCPILYGNHERYVARYGTADADPRWRTQQFAPVQWAVSQLTPGERFAMRELPRTLRLEDVPDLLFVHASVRSDKDTIWAHTPDDQLSAMFPDAHESLIVRAHNHIGQVRVWERGYIVTAGSVGFALDGNPTAQYLLVERGNGCWRFQHQSAPYDVDRALDRFRTTGYLEAAGPIGRLLYREVSTAAFHLVPFLRAYARWSQQGQLSLEQAVERFLADGT